MKRILCSLALLLASFIAGAFTAPASDSDPLDKDLSLVDRTIIEEILNSRRSKIAENSWYDMISRNPYWNPWMTPGMGYSCPCSANPYSPVMGAPVPFFGIPSLPVNPPNRYPELNSAASPSPSYAPNQSTEFQTRMLSGLPYASPVQSHQPISTEEAVQQRGLIKALRSRFKAEIASLAAKISPSDLPPLPATIQPSPTIVRTAPVSQRSSPGQQSSTAHHPSRLTKSTVTRQ